MSQKIYTNLDIKGNATIGDITNATSDTDKFLVSDAGVVKYRTGSEMLSDLGVAPGVASNVQHQVKAGVAINKGQAVYVTSADGTNMIVGIASNASEATSSKTMGLLDNTVAVNGFANVVTEGLLAGLNTVGANAGDPVWLGTNGNLIYGIANKPYAPAHLVFIGIVTRVNANNGEIFVKVQNGFELDELHDVDLKSSTPIGNQILAFEGAPVNLWKNKSIAAVLGYTPYNASNPAGYISSYTETDTLSSVTGRGASTSNQITLSGGGDNSNTYSSLRFSGYNQGGGVGYHGFFEIENTYSSGTNKKKFFRLDSSGTIQIINSAYTSNIFNLTDAGDLTVNKIIKSGGTSSQYLMADGSVSTGGGGGVTSFNTRTGAVTLSSGDVTGALGYTPISSETDTLATVTARGASTSTRPSFDGGITVNGQSYVTNSGYFVSGANGFRWNDSSGNYNNVIMRDNGTTWFRNYLETPDSMRSSIYYDYNDTTYYLDPASTGLALKVNGNIEVFARSASWAEGVRVRVPSTSTWGGYRVTRDRGNSDGNWYFGYVGFDSSDDFVFGSNNNGTQVDNVLRLAKAGNVYAYTDLRSPIFYDLNNTGYYVDPASTTNLNTTLAYSYQGNGNVGGTGSAAWFPSGLYSAGTNWLYGVSYMDDVRSYIFYDRNNTGYYCDPASGSNFSSVYADNWFRTYGQTGLYSQSYGIHFYPQTGSAWSITGSGGNIELQFRSNHNSTIRGYVYADTSNNIGFLTSGGGWRLRCDDSGNAIATGDVTAYSDRRVKENIHTIDNALNKVNNLRGVYYTRVDSEDKKRKVGVIAQETLEVLPEVVGQDTDGMYNVAYGNITAVLIEAIKEQQKQIEELKELINQLIKK